MSVPDGGVLTEAELQAAYDWFAARPAIREVILTGGDPFMLSPRRLASIVQALSAIPHIEILRIHTRVPVADPERVTETLADTLDTPKSMWIVLHANHAREFTPEARTAIRLIQARGDPGTRPIGAAARRERRCGGVGGAVPGHAGRAREAVLPAPA